MYQFSEKDNKILINTTDSLIAQYQENLTKQKLTISSDFSNQRVMSYNMMVVSNETGKMGVLDLNGNSIIGYKYSGMQFDEYSQRYIVSNDNKYGIISKESMKIYV